MTFDEFKSQYGSPPFKRSLPPEVQVRIVASKLAGGREWDHYCPECGHDTVNYGMGPYCGICRAESPEYKESYAWADYDTGEYSLDEEDDPPAVLKDEDYLQDGDKGYKRR